MLLTDTYIHEAIRELLTEFIRPGPFGHGGCNGNNLVILFRQVTEGITENFSIGSNPPLNFLARPVSGSKLPTP